ncbi:hypothetical protein AMATHDRAFT_134496 [Amanita thiersii Skay4041]|uniref:Cupin type-2 domain-containing protein n=1 Tax=Amanita thiersii Skay4041 TaxID=703135 RepID=A0A2A9P197_9AGAR|nr:hypothetical protein AMATHDRAFT_134496 [Amanita thiersii Skay4041]
MADSTLPPLPPIRRIVTGHNEQAIAVVASDVMLGGEVMTGVPGGRGGAIWITTDSIPTRDNNSSDDGAKRVIDAPPNMNLVHPSGTNLRFTDIPPGAAAPMHRTSSVDYNILVTGELIHITEDGTEKHLKAGDIVIQKGTMHSWRNPSSSWARLVSVLIAAEPAVVNGQQQDPRVIF